MDNTVDSVFAAVVTGLAKLPGVRAVGKSGGKELMGGGDIDLFVFCDEMPPVEARWELALALDGKVDKAEIEKGNDPYWGVVDFLYVGDDDICIMFHDAGAMVAYLESVLRGERLEKEGGFFYPTGRCATILHMGIFYDDGFLASIQKKLSAYPDSLGDALARHHIHTLRHSEDFRRAVAREDPLFYHCALEEALDHYVQALFAMNRQYFPGRKRNLEHIGTFALKPKDVEHRLLLAVELGGKPETLKQGYKLWMELVQDLKALLPPVS